MILKHLLPLDDKHNMITRKTRIEVIPDSLVSMRIPCHGKDSPCKVFFRYFSDENEPF